MVAALKTWFEQQLARVSAKASIAEENRYGLNHWEGLTLFLDDGRIELDTNIVERGTPVPRLDGARPNGLLQNCLANCPPLRKLARHARFLPRATASRRPAAAS